jgi:hypothetical protein
MKRTWTGQKSKEASLLPRSSKILALAVRLGAEQGLRGNTKHKTATGHGLGLGLGGEFESIREEWEWDWSNLSESHS